MGATKSKNKFLIVIGVDDDEDQSYRPSTNYFSGAHKHVTQFQPLTSRQVKNSFGAYVWQIDDMTRLQRYLFLGTDRGSYRASAEEMKRENARCIDRLIGDGKGEEVVEMIKGISLAGRAPKQQPTLFALAICARSNDEKTKKAAYEAVNAICRIPTHLFLFVKYCESMSAGTGWGRAHRRAITEWYLSRVERPLSLARHLTKYRAREDWSHKDLFRLSHIKPETDALKLIVRFVVCGIEETKKLYNQMPNNEDLAKLLGYLEATEGARKATDEGEAVKLIQDYGLEREHVSTQLLNSKEVWEALLENMQMMAIIRNLGKITSMGLVPYNGELEKNICEKLRDQEILKRQRIHPFSVLLAMNTYHRGRGDKGKLAWIANQNIVKALDDCYYLSFAAVEPTGKRYLLAVDVSGSMNVPCLGSPSITCRDAAAAMLMITARTEENYDVVAFSDELTPMDIKKTDTLKDVIYKTSHMRFGGTDCALPMIWADERKKKYDVFIVYTDNETWYGKIHPSRALQDYRLNQGIPDAKLIVIGMCSNGFSIADPDDFGMLDIVGFDSGATETIAKFSIGTV